VHCCLFQPFVLTGLYLRQVIKDKQDSSPQADITLGKVTEAEIAASEKDTSKVVEHLKSAGKGMKLKPR
jgi:hypothetical protein